MSSSANPTISDPTSTDFASADRSDMVDVAEQFSVLQGSKWIDLLTNAAQCFFVILNANRQVVYYNELVGAFVSERHPCSSILGRRPGEILHCIYSSDHPSGCGTAKACANCGAVQAVLTAIDTGKPVDGACTLTTLDHDHLDLSVRAVPFAHQGIPFIAVSLIDISDKRRRDALEQTFLHDIKNTLGVLIGYADILEQGVSPAISDRYAHMIHAAATILVDQVDHHRQLLEAEDGTLAIGFMPSNTSDILTRLLHMIAISTVGRNRQVTIASECVDVMIDTDPALVHRVLENMVTNALEASTDDERVIIDVQHQDGGSVVFSVSNPQLIDVKVGSQIFQRNFSTKGTGRGLGTYGMKLIGERYLHGRVWFDSTEHDGTCFYLELPRLPSGRTPL